MRKSLLCALLLSQALGSFAMNYSDYFSFSSRSQSFCNLENDYFESDNYDDVPLSSRYFVTQFNEIKDQIRYGQRTFEDAFDRMQERYDSNINSLLDRLQNRDEDFLSSIERQHTMETIHLSDAYRRHTSTLERMLDDANSRNRTLEMERKWENDRALREANERNRKLQAKMELCSRVNRIFRANPYVRPEKMLINSENVKIYEVHEAYDKFELFAELYGHYELGVTATRMDLEDVRRYVEATKITVQCPEEPKLIHRWLVGNVLSGKYSDIKYLAEKYGVEELHSLLENHSSDDMILMEGMIEAMQGYKSLQIYDHYRKIENNERTQKYNEAKRKYDEEVYRIKYTLFPANAFDRLVRQYNKFINVL